MTEDFNINELPSNFNIRTFIFKVLGYWKLFVVSVAIACGIAYSVNIRKQNVYALDSLISVENDQNPFFTANTSISFNWGGVTSKVQAVITTLKTRTHNERVIDSLQYYLQYMHQGKYHMNDVYTNAPFEFHIDKTKPQILGKPISVTFTREDEFELVVNFESENASGQIYQTKERLNVLVPQGEFRKTYKLGEVISTTFLNGRITSRNFAPAVVGKEYFIRFLNFDGVVNQYKNGLSVTPNTKGSSVLKLRLSGANKGKIVDYLNTTVDILERAQLERKNLFKTVKKDQ